MAWQLETKGCDTWGQCIDQGVLLRNCGGQRECYMVRQVQSIGSFQKFQCRNNLLLEIVIGLSVRIIELVLIWTVTLLWTECLRLIKTPLRRTIVALLWTIALWLIITLLLRTIISLLRTISQRLIITLLWTIAVAFLWATVPLLRLLHGNERWFVQGIEQLTVGPYEAFLGRMPIGRLPKFARSRVGGQGRLGFTKPFGQIIIIIFIGLVFGKGSITVLHVRTG